MSDRVLVVEDDDDIREALIEVLADHGYDAIGAEHGGDALLKLRGFARPPCLILLDLMMPVMDGRTFRDEQLADPTLAPVPVIVLSAARDLETAANEMQVTAALAKPFDARRLLATVAQYCRH